MIRQELKSQVNLLEKRIAAAVQAKRDEVDAPVSNARMHAAKVAMVALYGEPKIEEPLRMAQSRMIEKLHREFGAAAEELWIRECGEKLNFFTRAAFYPILIFNNLPGGDDNSKFEPIFSEAPAWLLKFTAVEWDAKLLGFKLRELVGAPELGRQARLDRNNWPSLPSDTIDAGGPCSEPDEPWEKIVERRCHERGRHP
jgi:hypothetical protein